MKEITKDLNKEQIEAVKAIQGPVLIIAGPGAGKTKTLTHRIAYMISSGIKPENILAITFTNKASQEMKERTDKLLGIKNKFQSQPLVGTFHSICARILRSEARTLGYTKNFSIYDEEDQLSLVKKVMEELGLSSKNFNPYSILNRISRLKSELNYPEELPDESGNYYQKIVNQVYAAYQKELKKANAMDFDDLIMLAVKLFQENPQILEKYQNQFKYVLVDEYQDTNTSQYVLTKLLTEKHKNLFAIGDTDQCLPEGTKIKTSVGTKNIEDIKIGDQVIAASGHKKIYNDKVINKRTTDYNGPIVKVTTINGKKLLLTPNHICFAKLKPRKDIYFVYLMYRKDRGYRIGTTVGQRISKTGEVNTGLLVRSNQEFADKMWILKVCNSKSEVKFYEQLIAFKYGIPTTIFFTAGRSGMVLTQNQINQIYERIDTRTRIKKLFEDFYLSKNFPHHRPQGGIRGNSKRITVNLTMFSGRGVRTNLNYHRATINTSDQSIRKKLEQSELNKYIRKGKLDDWRIEIGRYNYADCFEIANRISEITDKEIGFYALISKGKRFLFLPASQLHPTFIIPIIKNGEVIEEEIKKVEWSEYKGKVYDIDIERNHNYLANGVVVHNSIYAWRNADFRNMLNFEKDFPEAKVIRLERNYRSTKTILAAGQSLIQNNIYRHQKDLWTENADGEKISVSQLYDEKEEANFIVKKMKELVKKGYKLNDFVILYRTHAQSRPIEEEFLTQGFPYKIIGALKFYERKEIKDILAYLKFIANPNDFTGLQRIYNVPARGFGKVSFLRLTEFSRKNNLNFFDSLLKSKEIENLPSKSKFALYSLGKTMEKIKQKTKDFKLSQLMKFVVNEIGYKEYLNTKTEEGYMRWENVKELLTVARKYDSLETEEAMSKFLEEVALIQETEQINEEKNMIYMMTLHSAKGLEFPVVFLVGMEEGLLPHSKSLSNPVEMEEERRLCYVGITRAKRRVFISFVRSRNIFGSTSQGVSSRFLSELPKETIEANFDIDFSNDGEKIIGYT